MGGEVFTFQAGVRSEEAGMLWEHDTWWLLGLRGTPGDRAVWAQQAVILMCLGDHSSQSAWSSETEPQRGLGPHGPEALRIRTKFMDSIQLAVGCCEQGGDTWSQCKREKKENLES